jgi:hypothetical protein
MAGHMPTIFSTYRIESYLIGLSSPPERMLLFIDHSQVRLVPLIDNDFACIREGFSVAACVAVKAITVASRNLFISLSFNRHGIIVLAIDTNLYVAHTPFIAAIVHACWNSQQQTFLIVVEGAGVGEVESVKTSRIITVLVTSTTAKQSSPIPSFVRT